MIYGLYILIIVYKFISIYDHNKIMDKLDDIELNQKKILNKLKHNETI